MATAAFQEPYSNHHNCLSSYYISASIEIIMEQFVFFAFKQSLVEFQNHRVLVGFLDQHCIVGAIQTSCSCSFGSVTGPYRLATAHNTATAACHYFNEMIVCFAVLYTFHNGSCICKTTGHTYIDIHSLVWNCEFFDSFISTDTTLRNLLHGLLE